MQAFALWTPLSVIVILAGVLGGVQQRWYLPAYAVLFALLIFWCIWAMWPASASGALPFDQSGWRAFDLCLLGLLLLPFLQLALRRAANPARTESSFLHMLAAAAVFWLWRMRRWTQREFELLAGIFASLAGFFGLSAMLQRLLTPNHIWGVIHIVSAPPMGSFVDHDDFAAWIGLLFPLALWRAVRPARGALRALWILNAALAFASVIASASRGGAIVILLELAAFLIWRWRFAPMPRPAASALQSPRSPSRSLWVLSLVLLLYAGLAGVRPLWHNFLDSRISLAQRLSFAGVALRMGAHHPLWGYGLGSWLDVSPAFLRMDSGLLLNFAHCDPAQWFADAGLIGCALLLALGTAYLWSLRQSGLSQLRFVILLALFGFVAHSFIEFVFHIPALFLLFTALAGLAAAPRWVANESFAD